MVRVSGTRAPMEATPAALPVPRGDLELFTQFGTVT
jgi:hypothetical protein